jgi:ubiquitin carboxyl-terminal hydrolase 14
MAPFTVRIKHAAKVHDIQLDPDQPPSVFKLAVYHLTGVPQDKMKIMIKGGILKDDTNWAKVKPKEGQTFRVIGAAGDLPKPPEKPITFLEDMSPSGRKALKKKRSPSKNAQVGLHNLGNTCYMNATIQALRPIPELRAALDAPTLQTPSLASALLELHASMERTKEVVTPLAFLQQLRTTVPQFSKEGAQQDAAECWTQIIRSLKDVPGTSHNSSASLTKFVEQYMTGEIQRSVTCDEAPEEPITTTTEEILQVECNISPTTDCMATGIMSAFDCKTNRASPSLGRPAIHTQYARLTRLPTYLTVKMNRFARQSDTDEMAKIKHAVEFPLELDALDFVADELKPKLAPINRRLKEIRTERAERMKDIRRTTGIGALFNNTLISAVQAAFASGHASAGIFEGDARQAVNQDQEADAAEIRRRDEEKILLEALVDHELKNDVGCSVSGLYDLVAIVAHEGAAANEGHYTTLVRKATFSKSPFAMEDNKRWYKFDDDIVSVLKGSKLSELNGGGDGPSAYILLYKSRPVQ